MDMAKYILTKEGIVHEMGDDASYLEADEKFEEAARLVIDAGNGSASLLQRRLEIGYARAARILDQLEEFGVLGHSVGNKPRAVLVTSIEDLLGENGMFKKIKEKDDLQEYEPEEWKPRELSNSKLLTYQKECFGKSEVNFPIGLSNKKKVTYYPISQLGHMYVYHSPLSNSRDLLSISLEAMSQTISPDILKLVVCDETRAMATRLNSMSHLLTPVITDQAKLRNALLWVQNEEQRRFRLFEEMSVTNIEDYNALDGFQDMPRIVVVINKPTGGLAYDEESLAIIERLMGTCLLTGIHLIINSPLSDRRLSKLLLTFPTKIIFKMYSTQNADLLGTDDAFDLESPNDFLFIPAYGRVEKLSI